MHRRRGMGRQSRLVRPRLRRNPSLFRPSIGPITAPGRRDPTHAGHGVRADRKRKRIAVPQTIALVDDDRNILTSVAIALESEGFTVKTYSDSVEALRELNSHPPDLAVLDIKMPRMDG